MEKEEEFKSDVPVVTASDIATALDYDAVSSEEAMAKAVLSLTKGDDIDKMKLLSEISDDEGKMLCALNVIGEQFDVPMLRNIIKFFPQWRVSLSRKGRNEIMQIGMASKIQEDKISRLRRVLGMR